MKVLHFISSLKIGGAEQALCNLLQASQGDGREHVVAYIHDGPCRDFIQKLGIRTYQVKGLIHTSDPTIVLSFARLVKNINPSIIHSGLWLANITARVVAWYYALPLINDLHGICSHEGRLRNAIDRMTHTIPTVTVAVAPSVEKAYRKTIMNDNNQHNLITIANGIDKESIVHRAQSYGLTRQTIGLCNDAFVIGAIGRCEPIKSYDVLLKAYAHALAHNLFNKKVALCLVGGGSQLPYLQQLTHDLNINDTVVFTGFSNQALGYYRLFDCFALSSQSEGLSIALLEALCFDLPIVTTNISHDHDVITPIKNGLIVTPNNIEEYSKALAQIVNNDSLHALMKTNNKALIQNNFTIKQTSQSYQNLYKHHEKKIFTTTT